MKAVLSVVAANVKWDQRPLFLMVRISSVKTATRILILPSALVVARSVNPIILTDTLSSFPKAVISEGLTYQNQPWHMHCFVCTQCKQSLTEVNFASRADKPYCDKCVGQLFCRQCFACTKHISGSFGSLLSYFKHLNIARNWWEKVSFIWWLSLA